MPPGQPLSLHRSPIRLFPPIPSPSRHFLLSASIKMSLPGKEISCSFAQESSLNGIRSLTKRRGSMRRRRSLNMQALKHVWRPWSGFGILAFLLWREMQFLGKLVYVGSFSKPWYRLVFLALTDRITYRYFLLLEKSRFMNTFSRK